MLSNPALAATILLLALSGTAAGGPTTGPPCEEALTTADMLVCAGRRFDEADRTLNQVYRELMEQLDDARRGQLRSAQRAWLQFRDAQARFAAGSMEGGSLAGVIELSEKAAVTEHRTGQLREWLPRAFEDSKGSASGETGT